MMTGQNSSPEVAGGVYCKDACSANMQRNDFDRARSCQVDGSLPPKKKPFLGAISTFDDVQSTKVVTLGTPFKVVHWTHKDSPGVEL